MSEAYNGAFDYPTGEAIRAPVYVNFNTFAVKVDNNCVFIEIWT